jgi:hypothetical protein
LQRRRLEVSEDLDELVEDRIYRRRVRRDIHGHLACHHVLLLPGCHQVANGLGVTTDDGRRR